MDSRYCSQISPIVTGASARKLWCGGVDLLGDRAVHRTTPPFVAAELSDFGLDGALRTELGARCLRGQTPSPRKAHSTDLRTLRAFRKDHPGAETAVLYRGPDRLRIDDIWRLPVRISFAG